MRKIRVRNGWNCPCVLNTGGVWYLPAVPALSGALRVLLHPLVSQDCGISLLSHVVSLGGEGLATWVLRSPRPFLCCGGESWHRGALAALEMMEGCCLHFLSSFLIIHTLSSFWPFSVLSSYFCPPHRASSLPCFSATGGSAFHGAALLTDKTKEQLSLRFFDPPVLLSDI